MEKPRQFSDKDNNAPAAKLINAKRIGIISIVGLGLLAYFYESDEPETSDQPTTESISRTQPKTLENNDFPLPESDLSEKRRKWKTNFVKFMKALKEAEENKKYHLIAKEVIDPQAYSDYLEALIEDNRNDFPREAKRLETAMGYMLDADSGLLDSNAVTIADWKNITLMLDNFDENNFGESAEGISKYFIAMSPTFEARGIIIYELENGKISKDEATAFIEHLLGSSDLDIVRYVDGETIVIGRESECGYYYPDW